MKVKLPKDYLALWKDEIKAREALIQCSKEYRDFHIFYTGSFNVVELPHLDNIFYDVKELEDYLDFCIDCPN